MATDEQLIRQIRQGKNKAFATLSLAIITVLHFFHFFVMSQKFSLLPRHEDDRCGKININCQCRWI